MTTPKTPWSNMKMVLVTTVTILTALGSLGSFGAWIFQEKFEKVVMKIVNDNKGESTKVILAREMDVPKDKPLIKLAEMYKESKKHRDDQDELLTKWIPYLEAETKWLIVGYHVNLDNPDIVKFHHWNGRDYDAWKDVDGWFYVKDGLKHYY